MTSRRAGFVVLLVLLTATACRSSRTPSAPASSKPQRPSLLEEMNLNGPPALQPYLDAYPLGDLGTRIDLLAATDQRSMHLLQARRAVPRHTHPTRTETVYVLRGRGTCYVDDRSYPVGPGATFKFAPGVRHMALPDEGETIVAVSYFEPPLLEGDDRVPAE